MTSIPFVSNDTDQYFSMHTLRMEFEGIPIHIALGSDATSFVLLVKIVYAILRTFIDTKVLFKSHGQEAKIDLMGWNNW